MRAFKGVMVGLGRLITWDSMGGPWAMGVICGSMGLRTWDPAVDMRLPAFVRWGCIFFEVPQTKVDRPYVQLAQARFWLESFVLQLGVVFVVGQCLW